MFSSEEQRKADTFCIDVMCYRYISTAQSTYIVSVLVWIKKWFKCKSSSEAS